MWSQILLHLGKIDEGIEMQRKAFETTCSKCGYNSREAMLQLQGTRALAAIYIYIYTYILVYALMLVFLALGMLLLRVGRLDEAENALVVVLQKLRLDLHERVSIYNLFAQLYIAANRQEKGEMYAVRAVAELKRALLAELNDVCF